MSARVSEREAIFKLLLYALSQNGGGFQNLKEVMLLHSGQIVLDFSNFPLGIATFRFRVKIPQVVLEYVFLQYRYTTTPGEYDCGSIEFILKTQDSFFNKFGCD